MSTLSVIVQIAILYFAIYAILKKAKGSRFGQALMGVGILVTILAAFTYIFHFEVLSLLLKYLLIYFAISTVVIFQPEIRRFLATIGALGNLEKNTNSAKNSTQLTPKCFRQILLELSKRKMGALFAIEQGISLKCYEESGTAIDAIMTPELIITIFTPPLPLHDGGAVIRNGRLSSAHCLFPVSQNPDLASNGMRHRAAVGLSEETDAIIFIVSEETGTISVSHNGKMIRHNKGQNNSSLDRWIAKAFPLNQSDATAIKKSMDFLHDIIFRFENYLSKFKGEKTNELEKKP